MRIACDKQRTAEWLTARVGRIGASNIKKAMAFLTRASGAKKSGDSSAERDKFILELAIELITRCPMPHYVSPAMDVGTEFEGAARRAYELETEQMVDQTGLVLHPTIDWLGASPDGLCLPTHGIEIKVPLPHTHMGYLREDVVPEEYIPQMQCGMLCCELPAWDFVSYCPPEVYPELPERFRLFIKRLPADPAMHRLIEEAAIRTMHEATELVERLVAQYPEKARRQPPEPQGEPILDESNLQDPAWGFLDSAIDAP